VPLRYCYHMGEGRPCNRLFTCWESRMPNLRRVVAKRLTREEWERYFETPAQSKMGKLVEIAEKTRKVTER
jgi:hypothetical protein